MRAKGLGVLLGLAVTGCGVDLEDQVNYLLSRDYDITMTWETPADIPIDVGAQVAKLEDQIYQQREQSAEAGRSYAVLKAVCQTDPSMGACEPARFPPRIPRYAWPVGCVVNGSLLPRQQCTMPLECEPTDLATLQAWQANPSGPAPAGNGCVDVSTWLEQVPNLEEVTAVAKAVNADLSKEGSLKSVKQVKKVTVNRVTVKFKSNSLTLAIPEVGTYVGAPVSDEAVQDARALIADGRLKLFGSLSQTPPFWLGNKNMSLTSAGKAALSEALLGLKATLAAETHLDVPPETTPADPDNCLNPATSPTSATPCEGFPKPDGTVKVRIEMNLTFTVNASG